jgi:hypothetical protein
MNQRLAVTQLLEDQYLMTLAPINRNAANGMSRARFFV